MASSRSSLIHLEMFDHLRKVGWGQPLSSTELHASLSFRASHRLTLTRERSVTTCLASSFHIRVQLRQIFCLPDKLISKHAAMVSRFGASSLPNTSAISARAKTGVSCWLVNALRDCCDKAGLPMV